MKQRRGIRRFVFRAGIFLLLGAIVNIAVAWGFAARIDPIRFPDVRVGVGDGPIIWYVTTTRTTGVLQVRRAPHDSVLRGQLECDVDQEVPLWSQAFTTDAAEALERGAGMLVECASGWPWEALRCSFYPEEIAILSTDAIQLPAYVKVLPDRIECVLHNGTGRQVITRSPGDGVRDGMLVSATPHSQSFSALQSIGVLPLRPIWPGFAINTLFYCAILGLLFALPGAAFVLRRWRRIKRGLCPACAYPVGNSAVCTECGKPVTPRSVEPAPS